MNSMSAFGSVNLLNVDDSAGTVPGVEGHVGRECLDSRDLRMSGP